MVVNEQGVGVRLSRRAVEGGEVNILFGHVNLDVVNFCRVECVSRLTDLKHDVVREVCEQVYRSHAAVEQSDSDFHRADMLRDVSHSEAGISENVFGVADSYGDNILAVAVNVGEVERL